MAMTNKSGQIHEDVSREWRNRPSSDRVFGLVFAAMFALIGLLPVISNRPQRMWAIVVAAAFLAVALTVPRFLRPLNRLWTEFGVMLHRVANPIVIAALFFGVVTPLAVFLRLLGKDPLRLRPDPAASTYWIERTPPGPSPKSIRNQF
jgi:hypothetical protein